jgi:hypothetical protein
MNLTQLVQISGIVVALFTVGTVIVTRTLPWLKAKRDSRSLYKRLGTIFIKSQLERTLRYYVTPHCQAVDPSGGEEPRLVLTARQKLFELLDSASVNPSEYRYIFLLADSGMGKTSALIGYYARHLRRWRKSCRLALVPLGIPDADKRIQEIENKDGTFLLLDAFDEDTLAIVDHVQRLRDLIKATSSFQRVLISCRTQFFSRDEEIPSRSGIIKVSARAAGESAEYLFHKIYLSPFSNAEVAKYIRRRYPPWRVRARRIALKLVKKIPNLSVRPMLLAHVEDLINSNHKIQYSFELYEEMVDAWLTREQGFVPNVEDLRNFSERLAVNLYSNAPRRGSERIPMIDLMVSARGLEIPLDDWVLTGRSLLNRDAEGNWKFAHRSIMEYLVVSRFLRDFAVEEGLGVEWTDQMNKFLRDMLEADYVHSRVSAHFPFGGAYGHLMSRAIWDLIRMPRMFAIPRFLRLCGKFFKLSPSPRPVFLGLFEADQVHLGRFALIGVLTVKDASGIEWVRTLEVLINPSDSFITNQYKKQYNLSVNEAREALRNTRMIPEWVRGHMETSLLVLHVGHEDYPTYFLACTHNAMTTTVGSFIEFFNSMCSDFRVRR